MTNAMTDPPIPDWTNRTRSNWHVMYIDKSGKFHSTDWPAILTTREIENRLEAIGATYWEIGA